jgi:hypothetical protein
MTLPAPQTRCAIGEWAARYAAEHPERLHSNVGTALPAGVPPYDGAASGMACCKHRGREAAHDPYFHFAQFREESQTLASELGAMFVELGLDAERIKQIVWLAEKAALQDLKTLKK